MAVELGELVDYIVEQLLVAETHARDRGRSVLELSKVDISLEVAFTKEGKAGLKVWVIEAGGGAQKSETHTINVSYVPHGLPVVAAAADETSGAEAIEGSYE